MEIFLLLISIIIILYLYEISKKISIIPLKFGFDLHGVLDDLPETFKTLNNTLYDSGHEIHILTGSHITTDIEKELHNLGIKYHYIFSITDYHKSKGVKIVYDENNTPWIDEELWNKTKAEYCLKHKIDLHFDDSDVYVKYFTTPYARIWSKNNRNGRGKKPKKTSLL